MAITAVNHKPQLDSQDVGLIFVREYYTFLNKKPSRLHAFYGKDSLFTRGDEGVSSSTAKGQEEIRQKIEECQFDDCKVLVTQVDSQVSASNGILIQVLGEMCNSNGPSQKFSQTFFLAPQPNGYYVLNDIFRFLKDEVEIDYNNYEEPAPVTAVTPTAVTAESSPIVHAKPVESVPISPAATPKATPQQIPKPPAVEPKKEEVKKVKEETPKKEQVETVKENNKKPATVEPTPEPVVEEKKKSKKSEQKQTPQKQQKQQQQEKQQQEVQQEPQQEKVASPVNATPAPKPSAPKTWANLTATATPTNGTTVPAKPAATNTTTEDKVTSTQPPVTATPAVTNDKPVHVNNNQQQQQHQQQNKSQNRKDVTQIFVKLVTEAIHEDQLIEAFSKIGQVKSCTISRGRNCAFVDFTTPEACQKALAQHKVSVSGGHTVLAEERRFNNQNQNNNRYNQNRNNQQSFDQRRSNNRKQNNQQRQNNQQNGKGRGVNQQQQNK